MILLVGIVTFLKICVESLSLEWNLVEGGQVLFTSRFTKGFRCRILIINGHSSSKFNGMIITQSASLRDEIQQDCVIFNCTHDTPGEHFFTFCNISIQDNICWNATSIWQGRFIGGITRRSSPGGRESFDIFHTIQPTSCHLSLRVFEKSRRKPYSSSCADIEVDAVVVKSDGECKQFTFRVLRGELFLMKDRNVKSVAIRISSTKQEVLLNFKTMTYSQCMEKISIQSFQVPNHIKAPMKRKLQHLRSDHVMEAHSRRIFYEMDYFKSQMSKRYRNFLSFVNTHLAYSERKLTNRELRRKVPSRKILNYFGDKTKPPDKDKRYDFIQDISYLHNRKELARVLETETIGSNTVRKPEEKRSKTKGKPLKRSRRNILSNKDDSTLRLKVHFSLEKQITTTDGDNEGFRNHLKKQLAKRMRVPLPCIQSITIQSGTEVSFTLSSFNNENNVMDDQSLFEAADFLKKEIREQRLGLTDLNGQSLMTIRNAYISMDDNMVNFSLIVLIVLCVTLVILLALTIFIIYFARRISRMPKETSHTRNKAYRNMEFGRDSTQSVGKYSYDSGLWLGPGAEPIFEVPEAPYYRPPTVDQVSSTPRPITAVRTRLKRNWNIDERALSTIPDDLDRTYLQRQQIYH